MGERNIGEFGEETMRGRTTRGDSFEGHLETGEQESNNRNPSNRYFDALLTLDKSSVQLETKKSNLSLQSKFGSASLDNKGVTRFVIIDSRVFFRECVKRSLQSSFQESIDAYSTFWELTNEGLEPMPKLVLLPIVDDGTNETKSKLRQAAILLPGVPTIVLSWRNEIESLREAMLCGARGYIPMTMGFEIAIEAIRLVLVGGIYFPAECVLGSVPTATPLFHPNPPGAITARELAVIQAIRQGKPNKIIAYELDVCESTIKVHLRHIMRKLKVTNRTEVAVKSAELLPSASSSRP
jgi:DNA-binding NarL/FixJ family response regulator